MPALGPAEVVLIAACVLAYGISKTAMPVAGVMAGGVLAAILGPAMASGFVVPLLLLGDLTALAAYRQHADWALIRRLVPGVLAGFAIAAAMFALLPDAAIARIVGGLILVSVVLEIARRRQGTDDRALGPRRRRLRAAGFGTLAGMTTMGANAGGAAMTLYLVSMRVPMLVFMGTSAWFFLILNVLKVPVVIGLGLVDASSLLASLAFAPALLAGSALGIVALRHVSQAWFERIALLLALLAAIVLLVAG